MLAVEVILLSASIVGKTAIAEPNASISLKCPSIPEKTYLDEINPHAFGWWTGWLADWLAD